MFFGLGMPELIIVLIILLVVIGLIWVSIRLLKKAPNKQCIGASPPSSMSLEERNSILRRREWAFLLDGFAMGIGINIVPSIPWIVFGYWLIKDSFSGRGLGKRLTGLRVVDANTGQPIGLGKSIARNWIFLIPFLPFVELIVANCRGDKRRLGDLMANTIVVKE